MLHVAYLIRFSHAKNFKKEINTLKKFLFSYQKHKAGVAHKLFILIKGSEVFEKIKIIRKIIPFNITIIKLSDEGYDLGSFTEFARYRANGHMFILNQHSIILKKNWLKIFNDTMKKSKADLVASTASFSSLSQPSNNKSFFLINMFHNFKSLIKFYNFPNYPNPHIRTNALLVKTSIWLQYFDALKVNKKIDAYEAESGVNNFYNFLLKNKKKVAITRSDGKYVTSYLKWVNFVPFRNSLQSKLIISDNHSRFYHNASNNKKLLLENETWRWHYTLEDHFRLKKNIKVSVVIVNFNTENYLKNCINYLIKNNINFINKIIIVDNASTDNSMNIIPNNRLIKIIKLKKNLGFAKGCNIGAKYCTEKYILFLNPDTRLYKNSIKKSLEHMENPKYFKTAILGAQMLNSSKKISISCSYFPNITRFFFKSIGLDLILKKFGLFMRDFDHKTSRYVDQVIGAFFLIRKKVFIKLNGFDERFFLFYEEVDLSLRAYNHGFKSFYNANVKCLHYGGGSTTKYKFLRDLNYHKNKIIYAIKHFNVFQVSFLIAVTFTIELVARILKCLLIEFSYTNFKNTLLTYYSLLRFFLFKKNLTNK